MQLAVNIVVSAVVISFAPWLSGRFPVRAGLRVALPVRLSSFVPFLPAERLGLSFWQADGPGCCALPVAFLLHRAIARALLA